MTFESCVKKLGMPVMLTLPQHFDRPFRVLLVKVSKCIGDKGIYEQAEVADKRGNIMIVKLETLSEVRDE